MKRPPTAIESAIKWVLNKGYRTADIAEPGCKMIVSTDEMGSLVANRTVEIANVQTAHIMRSSSDENALR